MPSCGFDLSFFRNGFRALVGDSLDSLLRKYGAVQLNRACDFGHKLLVLIGELHEKQITLKGFDSSMVYFDSQGEALVHGIGYYRILLDMVREEFIKIPKGDSHCLPWTAPEPMDWSSVPAIKYGRFIIILNALFQNLISSLKQEI